MIKIKIARVTIYTTSMNLPDEVPLAQRFGTYIRLRMNNDGRVDATDCIAFLYKIERYKANNKKIIFDDRMTFYLSYISAEKISIPSQTHVGLTIVQIPFYNDYLMPEVHLKATKFMEMKKNGVYYFHIMLMAHRMNPVFGKLVLDISQNGVTNETIIKEAKFEQAGKADYYQ